MIFHAQDFWSAQYCMFLYYNLKNSAFNHCVILYCPFFKVHLKLLYKNNLYYSDLPLSQNCCACVNNCCSTVRETSKRRILSVWEIFTMFLPKEFRFKWWNFTPSSLNLEKCFIRYLGINPRQDAGASESDISHLTHQSIAGSVWKKPSRLFLMTMKTKSCAL